MSDTYRPPAETAALDQAGAFLREEAANEEVALLLAEKDQKFCAGAMFAFGAMVKRARELGVDPGLWLVDLADAWQDLMARRHGA